ncbi:MAG: tryptophan synthase subunit alpha [Chloroflexota bacterium]
MSRIVPTFERLRAEGRPALITYLTVGYPSLPATLQLVPRLVEAGCDIVELGIPFSDPLADGATIQAASFSALEQGISSSVCLETAARLREVVSAPLVFMSYYNPVLRYGLARFSQDCRTSGVDGLIVPDLPPEEGVELHEKLVEQRLDSIYLLAPTSTRERIRHVAQCSSGFIYLVSLRGVTGARPSLPMDLTDFVGRVRRVTSQPLCVGFGIATPEQAQVVARLADGVIVGSRLIQVMEESRDPVAAAVSYVAALRQAIDQSRA